MATGRLGEVFGQLCGTRAASGGALSDAQLLDRFVDRRDAAAFAALVARHGPMVLGVCRRVLRNAHDAEDAFQATFLVLVRRAASVVPRERVGNWLYGVAFRTALEARAAAARRRAKEAQARPPSGDAADAWHDLFPLLDEELSRMPEKYRAPLVLCDLEGRPRREAAGMLGWPEGTVATRLAAARRLLARRLTRRGLTLSAGVLALLSAHRDAAARVPAALLETTARAASAWASGQAVGAASTRAAALAEGALKGMSWTKLKLTAVVFLALATCAAGVGLAAHASRPPAAPALAAAPAPVPRAPAPLVEESAVDAWQIDGHTLRSASVLKEIKATAEQSAKVAKLYDDFRTRHAADLRALARLAQQGQTYKDTERFARLEAALVREVNAALPGLFQPEQVRRLRQVDLQWRGPEALYHPTVVKALKLSDARHTDAAEIGNDYSTAVVDLITEGKPAQEDERKVRGLYRAADEKFVDLLSEEQRRTWKAMKGEPLPVEFGHDEPLFELP
jgi:RNA polymerase sigma factor (sigma-70 family)